ncbi:extracellular solute-binding protein [Chondromyces apiculatus]|nr:extracellular solute-binding protein [Chondromyces apiculatus]
MRSRILASFTALLVLLALLVSARCPGLVAPARAEERPIRVWHAKRDAEARALGEVLATYQGATLDVLPIPYDAFARKLEASVPIGDGPDLFIDQHDRLGNFRGRNIVAPVGDALEGEAAFIGPALDAVRAQGAIWGLPIGQKCLALFVNTALAPEVPADLEGIAELKSTLPRGVYPLVYEAQGLYAHAAILGAFGVPLLTPDEQFGVVGPDAARSLTLVRWLLDQKAIPEDAQGALVGDLFKAGQAAFAISGPWFTGGLSEAVKQRTRVVPLPRVRATGQPMRPLLGVEAVFITPEGARRPEVRALARHLASAAASQVRLRIAGIPPARADVEVPADDPFVSAFVEQAKVAVPQSSSPASRSVWDPMDRAIRKVLRGVATPEEALDEAKHRFDDVRRPLPPPASPAPLALVLGVLCLFGAMRWLRQARSGELGPALKRSLPAYKYVLHAVLVVGVLVIAPLVVGAATSLFASRQEEPQRYVGLANFIDILTARGGPLFASGSFYLVLAVTLLWTAVNVFFHVTLGGALALVLHRPTLRLRALYRVLLIVPWAVPSYVTALSWKGMFHRQYGAVTGLLEWLNGVFGTRLEPISWFSSFATAFTANAVTNIWLGFPFMMVVTLGALTAVPDDVLEAAWVDGASRWQRLTLIVLPMIRPTLAPSVTLGAIWTFNMFNVVFLVSGGDPDGTTDILISEAYRWAFTREGQYGYAAAYSVLIFLLLVGATRTLNRRKLPAESAKEAQPAPGDAAAQIHTEAA